MSSRTFKSSIFHTFYYSDSQQIFIYKSIIGAMEQGEQEKFEESFPEPDAQDELDDDFDESESEGAEEKPKKRKRKAKNQSAQNQSEDDESIFDDNVIVDKLPEDRGKLREQLNEVERKIAYYKVKFIEEELEKKKTKSHVGENAVPICADVTKLDFDKLITKQLEVANREFDVIMMDPPWKLSTSQPSRGVAIQYSSLSDDMIGKLPIPMLQKQGFLMIWVINAKFQWTVNQMEKSWGYKIVDTINWVKRTPKGNIAKGHGFYLQHAKETCIVGLKGDFPNYVPNLNPNVIFSDRKGQSQKPLQIYEIAEALVPNGYYLQIFGRRNNLRDKWVTIGNQL